MMKVSHVTSAVRYSPIKTISNDTLSTFARIKLGGHGSARTAVKHSNIRVI